MKLSSHSRAGLFVIATLGALWVAACSDDDGPNGLNGLGGGDFGGASGATVGGATHQGGSTVGQGGTATTGGSTNVAGSGATPTTGGTATAVGGSSSVGGSSAAGAPSAGAGGGTAVCGTTKGSFQYSNTTVTGSSTLPLNGFNKAGTGLNTNANQVVDIVTAPATLCSGGCLRVSGTFAAGDEGFKKTVAIQKSLSGAAANLLGAQVVVKLAIENPANVPIQLSLFSQGTNSSWGSLGKVNSDLTAHNGTFADFTWNVADIPANVAFGGKPFCADSATNIGVMLQTGAAVTAPGTVDVYIKSIEIRPSGYVQQGTGGASSVGGSAGSAGWLTAGNAGTAGNQ